MVHSLPEVSVYRSGGRSLLPEYAEEIIKFILGNYFYFDRINEHSYKLLLNFVDSFPNLKSFFIRLIIEDPIEEHYKFLNLKPRLLMVIKSELDLIEFYKNSTLTWDEKTKLIQFILSDPNLFETIVSGYSGILSLIVSLFKDSFTMSKQEESINIKPNEIIWRVCEGNKIEYSLINSAGKLVKEKMPIIPNHNDSPMLKIAILLDANKKMHIQLISLVNRLINLLLTYPSLFEKIVKTDKNFAELKKFVNELKSVNILANSLSYDVILNAPNQLAALNLIRKNYADIRRAARAVWQGVGKEQDSELKQLPPEILAKIISFVRNPAIMEAEAYNIACRYLSKPILFIDNINDLESVIHQFPHLKDQFGDEILANVDTYTRIIRSNEDFNKLKNLFTEREVFKGFDAYADNDFKRFAGTIQYHRDIAVKDYIDYIEMRKNSRVLGQASRDPTYSSPFSRLATDVLANIITESRPNKEMSKQKATQIAHEYMKKPGKNQ